MLDDVWVYAETAGDGLRKVTLEALACARGLAAEGGKVSAVLLGQGAEGLTAELAAHGADRVFYLESEELAQYRTEPYTRAIGDLLAEHGPAALILGATAQGKDLAPRLAARLDAGLAPDCTQITAEDGKPGCRAPGVRGQGAGPCFLARRCPGHSHPAAQRHPRGRTPGRQRSRGAQAHGGPGRRGPAGEADRDSQGGRGYGGPDRGGRGGRRGPRG